MSANIVKALKHLGLSEKMFFFRFQKWKVAGIFDPPYLLKCTFSLLLKHNVASYCEW